jgi:hypothetical protein
LSEQGRLVLLENVEQVRTRIKAVRRERNALALNHQKSAALETIVNHITDIAIAKDALAKKHRR